MKFRDLQQHNPRPSILLLCDNRRFHANTVQDHIGAIREYSDARVHVLNPIGIRKSRFLDLHEFDAVIIHYSINILSSNFLSRDLARKLASYDGSKIQFIQDDYRRVNDYISKMREIGIEILFTSYASEQIPKVWSEDKLPNVRKFSALTGYVPDRLVGRRSLALKDRPIEIGYRGRMLPCWLGELGQEKTWIAKGILERANKYNLHCDIAWTEDARIYGAAWDQFLVSCKSTLGTESGASITDFDGSVEQRVTRYLAKNSGASFAEVQREILEHFEGNLTLQAISPRMFEAIAARTGLILFPGNYSGVLRPWLHHIPLEKNFSNMDKVVEKLRDIDFMNAMVDRAYQDIVASGAYSYRQFMNRFNEVVKLHLHTCRRRRKMGYRLALLSAWIVGVWNRIWGVGKLLLMVMGNLVFAVRRPVILRILLKEFLMLKPTSSYWVMKDISVLRILRGAQSRNDVSPGSFSISTHIDRKRGHVRFVSHPRRPDSSKGETHEHAIGLEEGPVDLWPALEDGIRNQEISSMVWDHSMIGDSVQYYAVWVLHFEIKLSHGGIHHFESLVRSLSDL